MLKALQKQLNSETAKASTTMDLG